MWLPEDRPHRIINLPARPPVFGDWPAHLNPKTVERMGGRRPYVHQSGAIEAVAASRGVILATGTSSGKSLAYQVPILDMALREPRGRALMIFPTKALAQDQLRSLQAMMPDIPAAIYDGDTPKTQRSRIRREAQIILTNPDMLHVGILPSHESWRGFLRSLRVVVVDEMHVYRGVFGSHVAWVLRRLLRLAEGNPKVIGCSATIDDPGGTFLSLTGIEPAVIDQDGAPRGPHRLTLIGPSEELRGAGANEVTARVLADRVAAGQQTLAFCRARSTTEQVLLRTRENLEKQGLDPGLAESYRAGYTPKERRALERALADGRIRALVSTNALELGIDVGELDNVVINGWPGRRAAFWQQSGRAGRGGRSGSTIWVAHDDPLDSFVFHEAETALFGPAEPAIVAPANRYIGTAQISCLAHERPIRVEQELRSQWSPPLAQLAESMRDDGELVESANMLFWPAQRSPAAKISIRSSEGGVVILMVDGEMLATMERSRALREAFPGAIYLHRGAAYRVTRLDWPNQEAHLEPADGTEFTEPVIESLVDVRQSIEESGMWTLASVEVTTRTVGFRRLDQHRAIIDTQELNLPATTISTLAVRMGLPMRDFDESQFGGIHGGEHALNAMAPLIAGCDRGDLGSAWYAMDPRLMTPSIYVYDAIAGGVGLAERLYAERDRWLAQAHQLVADCPCEEGCPRCLLSAQCPYRNEPLDKPGTVFWLDLVRQQAERD